MNLSTTFRPTLLLLMALLVTACASTRAVSPPLAWSNATQMVVVTSPDWDATRGELRLFQRDGAGWVQQGAMQPVMLGRSGSAWGIGLHPAQIGGPQKREGDGRNPAGVFALGEAFGYAERADSGLPYRQMQASHWCMDVNASPLYNRIVDSREVGEAAVHGSSEPMRLDLHKNGDVRYQWGFVIQHNPANVSGMGSCIFAHLWGNPDKTTAGCTAMSEPAMRDLLARLDPFRHPVFVLMPETDYTAREVEWQLPAHRDFR